MYRIYYDGSYEFADGLHLTKFDADGVFLETGEVVDYTEPGEHRSQPVIWIEWTHSDFEKRDVSGQTMVLVSRLLQSVPRQTGPLCDKSPTPAPHRSEATTSTDQGWLYEPPFPEDLPAVCGPTAATPPPPFPARSIPGVLAATLLAMIHQSYRRGSHDPRAIRLVASMMHGIITGEGGRGEP